MANSFFINFERKKNLQAFAYTTTICIIISLLFFYLQWQNPTPATPISTEGIEINLGDNSSGSGTIEPLNVGTPASETTLPNTTTATTTQPTEEQPNIATDDNAPEEIAAIAKPVKPISKVTPSNSNNTKAPATKVNKTAPTTTPNPTPQPKALFTARNGTGNGGNNADSYNNSTNQGISGGKGNQGSPNGTLTGDSYTAGNSSGNGKSGISISKGLKGRRFKALPNFEDDFNENARVYVNIVVDKNGKVTDAKIDLRLTTTANSNIKRIALKKAKELSLSEGSDELETGTILFNFIVRS